MRTKTYLALLTVILCLTLTHAAYSAENPAPPFNGQTTEDDINLRTDSTVSAEPILKLNKGVLVNVNAEKHGWYKVKLPSLAPSYIKKTLLTTLDNRTAKISKTAVNIRLRPSESSPIIGKAYQDEVVTIVEDAGEWARVVPVANSYGWINKKFIILAATPEIQKPVSTTITTASTKIPPAETTQTPAVETEPGQVKIVEGIVKSYGTVFWRTATHQIATDSGEIFLLKGDKKQLNALKYHRVRVIGKLLSRTPLQYLIIEIEKLEALN